MFQRAILAIATASLILLGLACAGLADGGLTPLPKSGESQCRYLKQFPRCVRLLEGDDLRRLAYTGVSDFASEFFYFNCVNQHYDAYVRAVREANAIGEDERIYPGDQLVLPQPECGDRGALTVSTERRALLDEVAGVMLRIGNAPEDSAATQQLAQLAPGAAGETLLLALTAPLAGGRLVGVGYAFAAPVSPNQQGRILAVMVLTWTETCLIYQERFLLEIGVVGAERLVIGSVGLHRNQPVEVRLSSQGCA